MKTISITKINNVALEISRDNERLVPIKPICKALNIDAEIQILNIREDQRLNSYARLCTVVGSAGEHTEALCLPLKPLLGWLSSLRQEYVASENGGDYNSICNTFYEYYLSLSHF